ncbi:MAG: phospho-sugar mutase [Myxococcota bacterium]
MERISDHAAELRAMARAWMADDPDPATRDELAFLMEEDMLEDLAERFAGPMEFGTAGLRGLLGAGPARMNLATISRAAAGLARQLLEDVPDARERGVVIGHDARRLSRELAWRAAEIIAGHGLRVHWLPEVAPTPLVAFAGRYLRAAGTAIVTASHNPPEYNGFKVYSERGSQIVPPQDARIREEMDAAGPVLQLPRTPFDAAVEDGRLDVLGNGLQDTYLQALDAQCMGTKRPPAQVVAVTTSLHGVGHRLLHAALRRRGFERVHAVEEQAEPDAEFPTVDFPNPEEGGALDLALERAREVGADLILANDPDADRLCVGVREPSREEGYRILTGNEIGVLLADWLLTERERQGRMPERPYVGTTIVSTSMLERLARHHGVDYGESLTGFKWIWDRALQRGDDGRGFVFGFEEALGSCVGPAVRDKDGIGAAQVAMECAAALKADGRTLLDRLAELSREHGLHLTRQVSTVLPGAEGRARIQAVLAALRERTPNRIGGVPVARTRDLLGPDAEEANLPRSNVLTFWLEDGTRLVIRPSGTEPKLKSYVEVVEPVADDEPLEAAEARAGKRAETVEAWVRDCVPQ